MLYVLFCVVCCFSFQCVVMICVGMVVKFVVGLRCVVCCFAWFAN